MSQTIGDLVDRFCQCPECATGRLFLACAGPDNTAECRSCGSVFPVIHSIPRLLRRSEMPRLISDYGSFWESAAVDLPGKLPPPQQLPGTQQDSQNRFRAPGGRDYHEARQEMSTVRYSLARRSQAIAETLLPFKKTGIESLLEVGCADGLLSKSLSGQYRISTIVGVDLQDDALRHNCYPTFQADCQELPFRDESFDVIVAAALIEHLPEPRRFLFHAHRILKTGGILVLTCPDPKFDWFCTVVGYFRHAAHLHRFSIRQVLDMLDELGWAAEAGRKFMLTPIPCRFLEKLEESALRAVLGPLMMNQVIHGIK